jgi:hypothetical protein
MLKIGFLQITQECINEYDRQTQKHGERPDFLAWLRSEERKGKPMSNRDMMNHLSNNLYEIIVGYLKILTLYY